MVGWNSDKPLSPSGGRYGFLQGLADALPTAARSCSSGDHALTAWPICDKPGGTLVYVAASDPPVLG